MKECVLFNEKGEEIDWYDPVEEECIIETETHLIIQHNNGHTYTVPKKDYAFYKIREKGVESND